MATASASFALSGLASRLVRDGVIDESVAKTVSEKANEAGISFISQIYEEPNIDGSRVAQMASEEFGVPYVDVGQIEIDSTTVELVSEKIMSKNQVLPLYKRGTKLFVALTDPLDTRKLDDVKFHTGLGIEATIGDGKKIADAIEKAADAADTSMADLDDDQELDDIDISAEEDAPADDGETGGELDTPIVRFVNKLLLDAINRGASDIHFEPYEKSTRVRFRVDGVLHEVASPPTALSGRISARIKILSRLDIAERRVPQDGRMKMRLSKNRSIDFRVSTLPTLFGEKVVIRILDASATELGVEALGFDEVQEKQYIDAIQRPYGMVLVTGPTGSGKTVSLYTALGVLNTPKINISTAEDPVEINVAGINQVNINDKANLTFAAALKSFLRQDPDVIMVGEIRDLETADISIKASQTGHLVLSTLHTNDCPTTITRLLNMGVPAFNVASSVHLILAQRLARKLCDTCKEPLDIPDKALLAAGFKPEELEELTVMGPKGCDICTSGYKGRLGIFQVMPISETMQEMIMKGCTSFDIEQQAAKEGVNDLRRSGLNKVAAGLTSLAEVERVTNQ